MSATLPYFTKGIKELDVPPLDPVKLDDIDINGNGLKLSFTDATMNGFSNAVITDLKYVPEFYWLTNLMGKLIHISSPNQYSVLKSCANVNPIWLPTRDTITAQETVVAVSGNGNRMQSPAVTSGRL